jgi:DNA polymerase-3 subunit chi
MPDYLFYHLERQGLHDVLPRLLELSLQRDWRCVVKSAVAEGLEGLSAHLWSYKEHSFLAHARKGDAQMAEHAAIQPIWLTDSDECPNAAHVLFLIDGAVVEATSAYQRVVYIFDGQDEAALAAARGFWKKISQAGATPTYWQQNEGGAWEKRG